MSTSSTSASDEDPVPAAVHILDRLLVLVDYSADSQRAVGLALELQRTRDSVVRVFHAAHSEGSDEWLGGIGSPSVGGDWVAESKGRLRRFLENIAPGSSSRVEVGARVGLITSVLPAEIRAWSPTLIIAAVSVHARMFRSPAEQLVHEIPVPTLIIPIMPEPRR
jgi:nucleotide-binding universal stress UspA family protein